MSGDLHPAVITATKVMVCATVGRDKFCDLLRNRCVPSFKLASRFFVRIKEAEVRLASSTAEKLKVVGQ